MHWDRDKRLNKVTKKKIKNAQRTIQVKCNVRFHNTCPGGSTGILAQNISVVSSREIEDIFFFIIKFKREDLR